jgi:uncharacterized RDD family membrane protein YckC
MKKIKDMTEEQQIEKQLELAKNIELKEEKGKEGIETQEMIEKKTIQKEPTVMPWRRFWARFIDMQIFMLLVFSVFISLTGESFEEYNYGYHIISFFLWIFVEAFLLSSFGTTIGKWALGIIVRDKNGEILQFSSALNRSSNVWVSGLGLGIPLLTPFFMLFSYSDLNKNKITSWDKKNNCRISHNKINWLGLIAIIIVLLFLWL